MPVQKQTADQNALMPNISQAMNIQINERRSLK
jgi:hypothetical protein